MITEEDKEVDNTKIDTRDETITSTEKILTGVDSTIKETTSRDPEDTDFPNRTIRDGTMEEMKGNLFQHIISIKTTLASLISFWFWMSYLQWCEWFQYTVLKI